MSKQRTRTGGRGTPVPIAKPFPWGTVVGGSALGLVLVGVLGYAVLNTGSAAPNPLRDADSAISGVTVAETAPSRDHKPGSLTYDGTPSYGGDHNSVWSTCTGNVYTEPIPEENATHSLEHGAVWVTYRPDLPADEVAALRKQVDGIDYRLMSPFPGLPSAISLQAWGRQLSLDSATDPRLDTFLQKYTSGPQTPERGAACSGGTTATVTKPAG